MSEKILILHSLLSGLDILTAIILLVAVLSGLATGLVVKLGQIVAVIGSYVIAAVLASYVGLGREIVFVVAFIVLSLICRYLVQVLRLVDKLPVVGTLDKFGGAVVGFVVAFIVLYFVINLFFDIVTVRGHVFAKNMNRTFVIFQQRQHTADRGGFSGAVWSQKSKNLPFFNVQVQVIQCDQITISFYKIFNMNHRKFLQFLVLRLAYFLLVIINVLCL